MSKPSSPLKILAVIVIPPHLSASGAVNAGKSLSRSLAEHCEVEIAIMSTEESSEMVDGIRISQSYSAPPIPLVLDKLPNKFRSPLYQSNIPKKILNGDYDLIHIHNPLPALEMKRVAKAAVERGIPYVVSTHGFVEVTSGGDAYSLGMLSKIAWHHLITRPLQYVVDHAALMLPTSPHDCTILEKLGVSSERMVLVTNGVSPDYYTPVDPKLREGLIEKWDLANQPGPIGFFLANHTANKGIHVLLEAFENMDVPFTGIIGGKKREGVPYPEDSGKPNADGQRIITTDRLSDEEVRAIYDIADFFVFPSLSDTLPLVVLEAMASGLPVLSTEVGGIPFQVPANCGQLVPPNDPEALGSSLTEMCQMDPAKRAEMGRQAKARVQEMFDWDQSAKVAYDAYQQIAF